MLPKISKTHQWQLSPDVYIDGINSLNFEENAIALFHFQYAENSLYRSYCEALKKDPDDVRQLTDIPFLPIPFFKSHQVLAGVRAEETKLLFESSGTTGDVPSRHYVYDEALYKANLLSGFSAAFGSPEAYTFVALLPSYLERGHSSLVHMARVLMDQSGKAENGFYLNQWEELATRLRALKAANRKTILLGVTFALLDFAGAYPIDLSGVIVMETGGMKGRREEWTREQVHTFLQQQWNLSEIATEYGMTELLSQAYSQRQGLLSPAKTMRVLVRDITDPLTVYKRGNGALNIIDLANVYSCAFIETEDIGIVHDEGNFEVLGRLDHAALRGCSLMVAA